MIIPIGRAATTDDEDDTPQEWSLLELNGELIPPTEIPQSQPDSSTMNMDVDSSSAGRMELGAVRFSADLHSMAALLYVDEALTADAISRLLTLGHTNHDNRST